MIVDERMVTFINSLDTENTAILEQIEQEALDTYVPIIRKEMQSFLKVLLAMQKPKRILEVGTAVGFSAILMSEYVTSQQLKNMRNGFRLPVKILGGQEKKNRSHFWKEMRWK